MNIILTIEEPTNEQLNLIKAIQAGEAAKRRAHRQEVKESMTSVFEIAIPQHPAKKEGCRYRQQEE